jgi:hypothetical protein
MLKTSARRATWEGSRKNTLQPPDVMSCRCGIDLGLQADFASVFQGEHRVGKRAIDLAEAVVTPRVRSIETDSNAGDSTFLWS